MAQLKKTLATKTKQAKTSSTKSKTVAKVKKLNNTKISKPKTKSTHPAPSANPRIVVRIKKTRKPRASNKPDMHYAARQRTNVCGTTKRTREGINLDEIFKTDTTSGAPIKRSKTMLKTIA